MVYNPIKILTTLLLLLAINMYSHAQYFVWKKRVVREINIAKTPQSQSLEGSQQPDSFLAQMFIEDAVTGKIDVYDIMDFGAKIPISVLTEKPVCVLDTIYIEDPVTGKEIAKPNTHDPEYEKMQNLRILEEWEYNPILGTTEIKILAIGPVIDRYGDDGIFRGRQTMFWVKYEDAINIICRYDKTKNDNAVAPKIWNDYFQSGIQCLPSPLTGKISIHVTRTIDLTSIEDTNHYRYNEYYFDTDTSLAYRLIYQIKKKKLAAFISSNVNLSNSLTLWDLEKMTETKIDTLYSCDGFGEGVVYRIPFNYDIKQYKILEDWELTPDSGTILINTLAIGPIKQKLSDDTTQLHIADIPMFWLRYNDVKDMIDNYYQYHPESALAQHIWHNYFKSDVKPQIVK